MSHFWGHLRVEGRVSPIVAGTKASSIAKVDPTQSVLTPPNVTIDMREMVEVSVTAVPPPPPWQESYAKGEARTRDPIIFGIEGFNGNPLPVGYNMTMDFGFLGVGSVPHGGSWATEQYIIPGAYSDPDSIFDSPPPTRELFFSLSVDNTGTQKVVHFTPGVSSSNFTFSFDQTPSEIEASFLAFLGGAEDLYLFAGMAAINVPMDNVTMANQDDGQLMATAAVPIPGSVFLFCSGLIGLMRLGRRVKED